MKIDKTEREFREAINRARVGLRVPVDNTVPFADALKAALDLEFKPEEPELPKRVEKDTVTCILVPEGTNRSRDGLGRLGRLPEEHSLVAIAREAAARYNAVERLVDDRNFPAGLTPATVRRTLEDERMAGYAAGWQQGTHIFRASFRRRIRAAWAILRGRTPGTVRINLHN